MFWEVLDEPGASVSQAAADRHPSVKTIATYRTRILEKTT
jgi:DNA-binding NarL/FixJ family response regulator